MTHRPTTRLMQAILLILTLCLIASLVSCAKPKLQPPTAKQIAYTRVAHGETVVDNYYWLRERENPDVIAYLEAENAYTDSIMAPTETLQEELFAEMRGRIDETDVVAPVKYDSFYYYTRTVADLQYKIYCRKLKSLNAPEQILLDANDLAEGHGYFYILDYAVSPDHRLLAYTVDTSGNELYTLYVKNLESGAYLPDTVAGTDGNVVWANDNKTLFYTTLDDILRPDKLYRHVLGFKTDNDVLVYDEKDRAYEVSIGKSSDRAYLFMKLEANASTEYWFLQADRPTRKFTRLIKRRPEVQYLADHRDGLFYIMTNSEAENFRIMTTPDNNNAGRIINELVPHNDSVLIDQMILFRDYMVLGEWENGLQQISVVNLESGKRHRVKMPEQVYAAFVNGSDNLNFSTRMLRFRYESLITPKSVLDYDMMTRELTVAKVDRVLGHFDPKLYITERIFATAPDGAQVPISLIYRKGVKKSGANPLYMLGYGSYGISTLPEFSSNRLSLIDRGFVYARAHVRGGSEMGRWWYQQGRLLDKMNTFTDFIACAEKLIADGYTSADQLAIAGGSAGGLLIGAVVNMRPDLFAVAVADVPFVDVVTTMLDPSIPLTVNEYTEWGNPENKEYYDYMMTYSPYDNVEAKAYPPLLITGGLYDPRVQYWEPAKWAAKLRAMKTDDNRLLLMTNMGAGHLGESGRFDALHELAFEYAFILDVLGRTR